MPLYRDCIEMSKNGKNEVTFLRGGGAELHQTGGEDSQTQ